MAKGTGQKLKLPVLQRILEEHTDEEHPLTVAQLIQALEEQGISAERKSVYDDMAALEQLGVDIQCQKGRASGWFVGERSFQLPELKLLVDAVQSCKFITRKKSDELIAKLERLTSVHQAKSLQRQVYVAGRVKTMNESVYYSIDKLHAAIAAGKAVSFRYFEYNVAKQRVFRRGGARYTVSPYHLIWDSENYYLAGYDHRYAEMRHYRVDKMAELAVTDLERQGGEAGGRFDTAAYTRKHFGMFRGEEAQVRLRCKKNLVGVVLDRFGQDVILVPDGEEFFTVTVEVAVSQQFLGWVFGLGSGVEVLSPQWVRQALCGQLEQMRSLYE